MRCSLRASSRGTIGTKVWFDDIVVATDYIGPVQGKPKGGKKVAAPGKSALLTPGLLLPPPGKVVFFENFENGVGAFRGGESRDGAVLNNIKIMCIVFVHPAEFLVTGPDGTIVERTLLGNKLVIVPDQMGTDADSQRVFYFDVPRRP